MASSEKFCLRWNDFEQNVSGAFRELREEKDFFDVTLACDDDNQLQAHKVIISACSPFFRNILRRNPHQHPLLYLKGVKSRELMSVLNFMYQGEVNVAQDDLNTFLSVAEELQVKGLTQGGSGGQPSKPAPSNKPKSEAPPPAKKPRAPAAPQSSYQAPAVMDDDIQEVLPAVKSEPGGSMVDQTQYHHQADQSGAVALEDTYQDEGYDYGAYDDGTIDPNTGMPYATGADGNKELIESVIVKTEDDDNWKCLECSHQSNRKFNMQCQHMVASQQYACRVCNEILKSRHALKNHMSKHTLGLI